MIRQNPVDSLRPKAYRDLSQIPVKHLGRNVLKNIHVDGF